MLYRHLQHHNDTIIKRRNDKDAGRLLHKNIYLSLYCKGSKGVTQGLRVRGIWRLNINCNILTPKLWPSALCLSRSPGLLNRRPRAHSAGWWLSLLHLISIFSGPQLIRAQMAPSAWCGFPYHILSITPSNSNCNSNSAVVLTALYNSSTPTRSLKSNVLSLSSGNNCHAVHRSLSSDASVYECTMGIF